MNGISILMYHALEEGDPAWAGDPGERLYVLRAGQFREQMDYLHREGFRTFLFAELLNLDAWPDRGVVLTFDDGHESNHSLALPILREYGFRAEFFITTGWIGTSHYLDEAQIRELCGAGMGIGSHGVTHAFMSDLPCQRLLEELSSSRQSLESITGSRITAFSAPGGRINRRVRNAAIATGYRMLCTSRPGVFVGSGSHGELPRFAVRCTDSIDRFAALATHDTRYINRLRAHAALLDWAKRILGSRCYEWLRGMFLNRWSMAEEKNG